MQVRGDCRAVLPRDAIVISAGAHTDGAHRASTAMRFPASPRRLGRARTGSAPRLAPRRPLSGPGQRDGFAPGQPARL